MNIDAILDRIQEDAQQAAAQTLGTARDKAEQMKALSEARIAAEREAALRDAQQEAVALRDRMLRMAALDERKQTLAMKREVIDEAFARALETMRAMPPEQAERFHIQLLLDSAKGEEQLIVAEEDAARFGSDFFERANEALRKAGRPGKLRLAAERRALGGGFVLEQGGMEINCSYESVLRTRRAALEAEVAAVLFA